MNGGKDVRLGDDKRPVSTVPSDQQLLYNIQSGEVLTDEFGNPLITEVDTYYIKDATMQRSTSVVFDEKPSSPYVREDLTDIATNLSATHADLDVNLNFTAGGEVTVLLAENPIIGDDFTIPCSVSGTTVTVNHVGHNLTTGMAVEIRLQLEVPGMSLPNYGWIHPPYTVTVVDANNFTYTLGEDKDGYTGRAFYRHPNGQTVTGIGSTSVLTVDNSNITWYNLELFGGPGYIAAGIGSDSGINDGTIGVTTNTTDGRRTIFNPRDPSLASPLPIVKVNNDQGTGNNKIYFDTSVGINSILGATVGDRVIGEYVPPGTFISNISHNNRIVLSNNLSNSGINTVPVSIRRAKPAIKTADTTWKIEEQFPDTSEVSSTLLGIPRAETQLSLFSNVSSYGIDTNEFETYTVTSGISNGAWESRYNRVYGSRNTGKTTEEVQESGIKLEIFPVPYSYPFPKKGFDKVGYYQADKYEAYTDFIQMGNDLHEIYNSGVAPYNAYPKDWKDSFVPDTVADVVVAGGINDVKYLEDFDTCFARIDTFTDWYRDMGKFGGGKLTDPVNGNDYTFDTVNEVLKAGKDAGLLPHYGAGDVPLRTVDNVRPGYEDNYSISSVLQSRRVFRYQPGRISGFTFGVAASRESRTGYTVEWGIKNPTDQYVFKIENGNLSIVRRSTIPLNRSAIERSGMELSDQVRKKSGTPYDDTNYWTLDVPFDNFNGDPLTGNGPSGYSLDPEAVTMYKIEFGWYGAIGCRFYAYIPVGSDGARWVVIHTFVIENSLGQPCLEDSYFRLCYKLDVDVRSSIKKPVFITKYGASYYIDGGDEGTSQIYSVTSGEKSISGIGTESLISVKPKDLIYNSEGVGIVNKKLIIPTDLNVSTKTGEKDITEVKTVVCKGCPGFGHVYTPGVGTTENGRTISASGIRFIGVDEIVALAPNYFTELDIGAKIIAPSIYDAYIGSLSIPSGGMSPEGRQKYEQAKLIKQSGGQRKIAGSIDEYPVYDRVLGITTNLTVADDATGNYPHAVRLSNYDGIAVSNFKLTGSQLDIQFANPSSGDDYAHFADFMIGVTDVEPNVDVPSGEINYFTVGIGTTTTVPNDRILFGKHSHNWVSMDADGVESSESWATPNPPRRMGIDNRIPALSNPGGGTCSKLSIRIESPQVIEGVDQLNVWPPDPSESTGVGVSFFLRLRNKQFDKSITYDGGQVGIRQKVFDPVSGNPIIDPLTGSQKTTNEATSSKYVGIVSSYTATEGTETVLYEFIEIDQKLNGYGTATGIEPSGGVTHNSLDVVFRPVSATGGGVNNRKLFNFNPYPLYLVTKMMDHADINSLSIKETIGDLTRTVTPRMFVARGVGTAVTTYGGLAVIDEPPTNFEEIERLSSAAIDVQNQQKLREPFTVIDNFYIGANESKSINLSKIFGVDRSVITPDNNNIEATFLTASIVGGGSTTGTIETSLNFKEQ